jgi:hypothetical protein
LDGLSVVAPVVIAALEAATGYSVIEASSDGDELTNDDWPEAVFGI